MRNWKDKLALVLSILCIFMFASGVGILVGITLQDPQIIEVPVEVVKEVEVLPNIEGIPMSLEDCLAWIDFVTGEHQACVDNWSFYDGLDGFGTLAWQEERVDNFKGLKATLIQLAKGRSK